MNPFPDMPNVTDIGDGRKLIETYDRGHCIRMIEPDGKVSMVIAKSPSPPPKPPAPPSEKLFHVRQTSIGQEIVSAQGEIIATTTDEKHAKHICTLLVVWENLKAKQSASGSSPGDPQKQN
jgi:hypothetical protein